MDKPAVKVSFHSLLTLNPLPPQGEMEAKEPSPMFYLGGGEGSVTCRPDFRYWKKEHWCRSPLIMRTYKQTIILYV